MQSQDWLPPLLRRGSGL
uniref:Uncharacterized protein n=1 Tax=Anguilla anguilla TaxID=7936 RepID=A0A0E9RXE1_ANGAN